MIPTYRPAFLLAVLATYLIATPNPAFAQIVIGNGGDLIDCEASSSNVLDGSYTLDYVATFNENTSYIAPAQSEPLALVETTLQMTPIAETFRTYAQDFNEQYSAGVPNQFKTNIWSPRSLGPIVVNDSYLLDPLPDNCTDQSGEPILTQAVFHEQRNGTRWYTYSTDAFHAIWARPLQVSMLLTHEFLWRYAPNARVLRDANYFLHSQQVLDLGANEVWTGLQNIGLVFNDQTVPQPSYVFPIDSFDTTTLDYGSLIVFPEFGFDLRFTNDADGFFNVALYIPDFMSPGQYRMHRDFLAAPAGNNYGPNYARLFGISEGYVTIQRMDMGADANGHPRLYKVGPEQRVLELTLHSSL